MKKLLLKVAQLLIPILWDLIQPMITELIDTLVKNMVKSNQQQLSTLMNAIKEKKPITIGKEVIDIYDDENLTSKTSHDEIQ